MSFKNLLRKALFSTVLISIFLFSETIPGHANTEHEDYYVGKYIFRSPHGTFYINAIDKIIIDNGNGKYMEIYSTGIAEFDTLAPGCSSIAGSVPVVHHCHKAAKTQGSQGEAGASDETVHSEPNPLEVALTTIENVSPQPAPLNIQPPKGWTLTNVETIFYLTNTTQRQTIETELGAATLTWNAASFTFNFGDQTQHRTYTNPGAPYPKHTITHVYKQTKNFTPTVTISWNAELNIAGQTFIFKHAHQTQSSQHLEVYKTEVKLKTNE
ncbi:hypothetical protein NXS08_06000 [Gleimia sp. 6138-11-ORH1]|uniref:hypothetical protein n=1 Tax=Gleimia sp. 6138-11-ORH1 TaxID=2973937 RepID=UPI002169EF3D|nr:hypothetical protein [Gleimia sp. 6138-11-ORH1]MCS4485019.1 hypothetical protein [Gleimia sp. 6138-11-ORH1]